MGVLSFLLLGTAWAALPQPQALDIYLKNQDGLKAYKAGKVDEARKKFGAAQAQDPESPELHFNQGVVQFKDGQIDSAISGFGRAAEGAEKRNDLKLAGPSYFNLGNALSKRGDVPGAARSYLKALEAARTAGDKGLESDARKNLELLAVQRQKQQQQQQQEKQNQDQNQQQQQQPQQAQNQQDEKKDGDKEDQQSGDKKNQQKQWIGGKRQEFKSQKLSKDDADRVMAELSGRERDLQAKLKKQRGRATGKDRDW